MAATSDSLLSWFELALWRGDRCLQRNLTGAMVRGQALTVRGPNGCGKTTLLRTLCGLSEAEHGEIRYGGKLLAASRHKMYATLAFAGHQTGLKADLSTEENLHFAAGLAGGSTRFSNLLAGLGLQYCARLPVRNLSAGQRRRAALARVLASGREFWVLDEPFSNLDQAGREWLSERLEAHLSVGGALMLTAHQPTGLPATKEQVLALDGNTG